MTSCLIVDESEVVRRVVRRMLESLSVTVDEAPDAGQALAACRAQAPNAVVLDSKSTDRAGLEFLRDLRDLNGIEQPAVLFCPLESEQQQVREALELGATEVLARPYDRAMLKSKLTLAGVL